MIVKMVGVNLVRFTDCVSAVVVPEIQEVGELQERFSIVFLFNNGKDVTFPLSQGDKIWYLNDNGRTIDRDFRMCCQEITKAITKT